MKVAGCALIAAVGLVGLAASAAVPNGDEHAVQVHNTQVSASAQPLGSKVQLNVSAFQVNEYECMVLTEWPSERVHCELDNDFNTQWVVEHFEDAECKVKDRKLPVINHTASGCFYFPKTNHSYNDKCNSNGTITVSAFLGEGCMTPMPITPFNFNFKHPVWRLKM